MGCPGRIGLSSLKKLALITLPVCMYLSDELILTFYWYPHKLQPCIVVIWGETVTQIFSFAPKYGHGDLNNGPNRYRLIVRAPQVVQIGGL